MTLVTLTGTSGLYPKQLQERLPESAPKLIVIGNLNLLALPKSAFFCFARCTGQVILAAHDLAARWRDEGRCVIGGFHAPVEKDCLKILLRGRQPMVICAARGLAVC